MEKNVGRTDRVTRWILAGGLAAYGLQTRGWRRWLALTVAGNLAGTAASGKCLINKAFGVDTREDTALPRGKKKSQVDISSEESFPASDAPGWAAGRAN